MKKLLYILLAITIVSCGSKKDNNLTDEEKVDKILENWHKAASKNNFDDYFDDLADDSFYMGTDATERWSKADFASYAKPYFDKKKAWDFKTLKRNITFSKDKKIVWFDELLNTQMKICRGSGIMIKEDGKWKIKQYVLSMTIPNEKAEEVTNIKSSAENSLINMLTK
jgi:hypothetical protein